MLSIPVDTSGLLLICTDAPRPRVVNARTGETKVDASGQTVFQVGLCMVQGRDSGVITVNVPGEPKGVSVGQPVQARGLLAQPWEQFDAAAGQVRHGIAWKAEGLSAAGAPGKGGAG